MGIILILLDSHIESDIIRSDCSRSLVNLYQLLDIGELDIMIQMSKCNISR